MLENWPSGDTFYLDCNLLNCTNEAKSWWPPQNEATYMRKCHGDSHICLASPLIKPKWDRSNNCAKQNYWFLDSIKVVPMPATILLSEPQLVFSLCFKTTNGTLNNSLHIFDLHAHPNLIFHLQCSQRGLRVKGWKQKLLGASKKTRIGWKNLQDWKVGEATEILENNHLLNAHHWWLFSIIFVTWPSYDVEFLFQLILVHLRSPTNYCFHTLALGTLQEH